MHLAALISPVLPDAEVDLLHFTIKQRRKSSVSKNVIASRDWVYCFRCFLEQYSAPAATLDFYPFESTANE